MAPAVALLCLWHRRGFVSQQCCSPQCCAASLPAPTAPRTRSHHPHLCVEPDGSASSPLFAQKPTSFQSISFLMKTSACPFLFLLPGCCWCPSHRHCWVFHGMAPRSHPNLLLGELWPNWERCEQHPHPWGHPVLGVTHPWGHSCSQAPISNAPFCCRCFCSTNPEASRPKSGRRAAARGVVSCCAAHTLPSPIPLADCPLLFFLKNFAGLNDCLSSQVN